MRAFAEDVEAREPGHADQHGADQAGEGGGPQRPLGAGGPGHDAGQRRTQRTPAGYLAASLDQPPFAQRAPVWVVLTADLGATTHRYPARHYRTVHLDAGVALQNVLLVATALGLSTCPVMGYDDAAWECLLDLPDSAFVAGAVALG